MILVDSSVWIDYFNGRSSRATDRLHDLVGHEEIAMGDLVAVEVLQGFRSDADFNLARRLIESFPSISMLSSSGIVDCAQNYRLFRQRGVTVRSTIDVIIATCCIAWGHSLLYSDRDFDPFVEHLGLKSALTPEKSGWT